MTESTLHSDLSQEDLLKIAWLKTSPRSQLSKIYGHRYSTKFRTSYTASFNWELMQYEWVSPSVENVLGYEHSIFIQQGLNFSLDLIHPQDKKCFWNVHEKIFDVFYSVAPEKRVDLIFSYNFRARAKDGTYKQLLRQSIFSTLNEHGNPLIEEISCIDISNFAAFSVVKLTISQVGNNECLRELGQFDFKEQKQNLSDRELQVLDLAGKGFTVRETAEMLFISVDTVKTHRKNILQKTGTCNIAEAIRSEFGR